MNEKDTWGSWSLGYDGSVLCHDGGYGIELEQINSDPDVAWWVEHLRGKGWGTEPVIKDFRTAIRDLFGVGQ